MRHVARRTLRLGRGGARLTSTCGGVPTRRRCRPPATYGRRQTKEKERERQTCEKSEMKRERHVRRERFKERICNCRNFSGFNGFGNDELRKNLSVKITTYRNVFVLICIFNCEYFDPDGTHASILSSLTSAFPCRRFGSGFGRCHGSFQEFCAPAVTVLETSPRRRTIQQRLRSGAGLGNSRGAGPADFVS